MRTLAAILFATSVVAPAQALADPATCRAATQWTSDAQLTLAVVRGGRIERDSGQCTAPFGSGRTFQAIDLWGKPTGVVSFESADDVGDFVATVSGSRGANVFVRPGASFVSAEWSPDAPTRRAFELVLGDRIAKQAQIEFFHARVSDEYAVVASRHSLAVYARRHGRWRRVYRTSVAQRPRQPWPTYGVRAIVDMNGDGVPEIIYHFAEYRDGRGFEVVLGKRARTGWRELADNEDTGP